MDNQFTTNLSSKREINLDVRKSANIKINVGIGIEYANEYMLDLLGYSITEFLTQEPKIVCHHDMPDIIHDTIAGFIMNHEEGITILKHENKNGDTLWAFTHFMPVYKPNGDFESYLTRRKPIPNNKINGYPENLKDQIEKLYIILKGIEAHSDKKYAEKYLEGFLEYKGYQNLKDYYMSFFNFSESELLEYFSINERTPQNLINKYFN
jgi:hypothetical protein